MPKSSKAAPKSPAKPTSRAKVKPGAAGRATPTTSGKAVTKAVGKSPATKKPSRPAVAKRQPAKAPISRTPSKKAAVAKRGDGGGADRYLEEQRALLIDERNSSERQARSLRAEAEQLAEEMEPGDTQFDEESGEGGTLNVERERDLALSAQAWAAVDEIDRALAKIDSGTYGICEQCGQPIPKARLKAVPYATLCVACKSGGLSRR